MKWVVYKELYVERLEARHPGSEHPANVRRVLDRFTKSRRLIERDVEEIRDLDLEQYVQDRRAAEYRGRRLEPRTINNEIQILNTCFAMAGPKGPGKARKNWEIIARIPYAEELDEYDRAPVVLSDEQLREFIRVTQFAKSPTWGGMDPARFWVAALVLGAITGLRRGALLKVARPPEEIFVERRELPVPAEISKTKRDQVIALGSNDAVFELFEELPSRPGRPLLPWYGKRGQPMTLGHFNNEMCRFQREAGIPEEMRVKTKYLRSTCGTELAEAFSDAIAKKRLNHSPGSKTLDKHYKGRRVSKLDHDASDMIAAKLVPLFDDRPPSFGIVG